MAEVVGTWKKKRVRIALLVVLSVGLMSILGYRLHRNRAAESATTSGAYCDRGIAAAKSRGASAAGAGTASSSADVSGWIPKINTAKPAGPTPAGMVWVPGGQFWMGSDDPTMPDTRPWHRVYVDGFW